MTTPPQPWSDALDDALGFLIADTARHAKRLLYARIAKFGIRGGSWYLLRALWEQDNLTQREIAVRLGITEPSTQEMLRVMEADGLVERTRDAGDRRKIRVRLTAHAQGLKAPLLDMAQGLNRAVVSGLAPAEDMLLRRLLKLIRSRYAEEFDALSADSADADYSIDLREDAAVSATTVAGAARSRRRVNAKVD